MEFVLYDNLFFLVLLLLAIQIMGGDSSSANGQNQQIGVNIREFIQHSNFLILSHYPLSVNELENKIKRKNGVLDMVWSEKTKTLKIVFNNKQIAEEDLLETIKESSGEVKILETQD